MFVKANLSDKQKQYFLKNYKNFFIIGDYKADYYRFDYNRLKKILFNENNTSNLDVYDINEYGDYILNEDKYNKLSLSDIDNNIQQVLNSEEVVNNLCYFKDNNGEIDPNYFCKVKIKSGYDWVKIPSYFFK